MAKAPYAGSRLSLAEYVWKNVCKSDKRLKVIQPIIIGHFDNTFWWVTKIVMISPADPKVGIPKKHEVGFVIVSESEKHKFKVVTSVIERKKLESKSTSVVKSTKDVMKIEAKG